MIVEESSKPKIPSVIEEKSSDQPIVSQLSIIPSSSADHGKITKPAPTIFKPHPPTGNPPSQIKIDSKPEAAKTPSDEEAKKFKVDLQSLKAPPGSPPAIKAPPGRKLPTFAKGIKENPKTIAKPVEVHPLKKENEAFLT